MDQRKHDRVRVEYLASISGSSYRAKGTVLNLSVGGYRIRTTFMIKKDDCLGVLIDIPKYDRPLVRISGGGQVVRWSRLWNGIHSDRDGRSATPTVRPSELLKNRLQGSETP